jgi:predicted DNA-binding transcriptional regulator AlpA
MSKTTKAALLSTLLTEAQVAEKWGLSRKTLQAWRIKGGGPKYVKMGRSVRYSEDALAEFQQSRTQDSTSAEAR